MMTRKPSALAGIFDDQPEESTPSLAVELTHIPQQPASAAPARRSSHAGKKPVLIHIPEDMHRALRQLSVEEGGEPLTVITERLLRQYLVKRGHTRFAP